MLERTWRALGFEGAAARPVQAREREKPAVGAQAADERPALGGGEHGREEEEARCALQQLHLHVVHPAQAALA